MKDNLCIGLLMHLLQGFYMVKMGVGEDYFFDHQPMLLRNREQFLSFPPGIKYSPFPCFGTADHIAEILHGPDCNLLEDHNGMVNNFIYNDCDGLPK